MDMMNLKGIMVIETTLYNLWFHLNDILKKKKNIEIENRSVVARG